MRDEYSRTFGEDSIDEFRRYDRMQRLREARRRGIIELVILAVTIVVVAWFLK